VSNNRHRIVSTPVRVEEHVKFSAGKRGSTHGMIFKVYFRTNKKGANLSNAAYLNDVKDNEGWKCSWEKLSTKSYNPNTENACFFVYQQS